MISIHDNINEFLLLESNQNVDVVMWPKFGNSSFLRQKLW